MCEFNHPETPNPKGGRDLGQISLFRFSRKYEYSAEFEARQMGFDFAVVARAVLHIAMETKRKASTILAAIRTKARAGWAQFAPARRPFQLVLPANDIHQLGLMF